jgi:glucose-6-phosphate 1-epimerase
MLIYSLSNKDVDPDLLKLWNYSFELIYTVELIQNTLKTSLEIINTDRVSFNFTCLLHTYFKFRIY